MAKLENVLSKVLAKVSPSLRRQRRIIALAEKLSQRVEEVVQRRGLEATVRVEGSVAKNTWLSEAPDIDIFMQVSPTVPRKAFGTVYLQIAREAMADAEQLERFAEHPYLEANFNGTRVNIVPCYRTEKGEWKSATDRTPFHTDYVKPLLDEKLCGEIRLLKQFMKGINVYGAEIKVGGFSGYLCELLILCYGSFVQFLEASRNWKTRTVIDLEGHYVGREQELQLIFEGPLVIVDPVDSGRNAASAVRKDRLDELSAASRAFLKKPSERFFYPHETILLGPEELKQAIENRGSHLIFLRLGRVETIPDILWGQLYKSQRALRNLVKQHDFKLIRDAVWSDEDSLNVFLLEMENRYLPLLEKHVGPPLDKKPECEKFLRKHIGSTSTLSGPRIEDGRWVVDKKRDYTDAVRLLRDKLKTGGRTIGIAELVSQIMAKTSKILVDQQILPTYLRNKNLAEFLTEYLDGKPKWLA